MRVSTVPLGVMISAVSSDRRPLERSQVGRAGALGEMDHLPDADQPVVGDAGEVDAKSRPVLALLHVADHAGCVHGFRGIGQVQAQRQPGRRPPEALC